MVCVGDLHISHRSDRAFEAYRLEATTLELEKYRGTGKSLQLLGDTFDSNSPSLEDIQAFYNIIDRLSKVFTEIVVIPGNHDYKVFEYLPVVGFTYINIPTTIGDVTYLPWTHLQDFTSKLKLNKKHQGKLLLTHARCTIQPHIVEEVSLEVLANRYSLVVLGDIHMPYSPYPNMFYTSEPSQHHYKSYSKNSTGYIVINDDYSIYRVFTDLPYKCKLPKCNYADIPKIISNLEDGNRYKIVVEDHVSNLQKLKKLKQTNIRFEMVPSVVIEDGENSEALKDMVSGKISVEQLLFDFISENYKFDPTIASKILRRIR